MIGGPMNPRLAGVRQSNRAQQDATGAPRTVVAVEPAEYFAVAFNDENGRLQRMVVLRVAGKVYVPPGSIEWSAGLRPAAEWLQNDVNRLAGIRPEGSLDTSTLPSQDEVDVLGGDQQGDQQDANPPTP